MTNELRVLPATRANPHSKCYALTEYENETAFDDYRKSKIMRVR